jgi:23S rRNA (cytosine1962-C5)-methyltransferase
MSSQHPRIYLRKDLSRHIRAGHPWVFADAVRMRDDLAPGTIVDLCDRDDSFLGRGYYDGGSDIAVRLFTLEPDVEIDDAFILKRVKRAYEIRRDYVLSERTNAFRWLHGEGDFLPGIVCDVYADLAVLKFDCAGARHFAEPVVRALTECMTLRAVVERHETETGRELNFYHGSLAENEIVTFREHGLTFEVDVIRGQKTGFFLDQRDNRLGIEPYVKGQRVLNCFAYTGGYSVYAARGGAREVVSVEIAEPALNQARRHFELNGLISDGYRFVRSDVFEYLRHAADEGDEYDVVILDPPALARNKRTLDRAERAYRDMNRLALQIVRKGGLLVACSCTARIDEGWFVRIVRDAAVQARRTIRLLEMRGQPTDHPVSPGLPEARYLKCLICAVD